MLKYIENMTMEIFNSSNQLAKRALIVLLILFSVCSLKLCAEDVTPAHAHVSR